MPKYDYKCINCSIIVEFQREFGVDFEPICCGQTMTRQWSPTGVIFNGSGFYSTDNRRK